MSLRPKRGIAYYRVLDHPCTCAVLTIMLWVGVLAGYAALLGFLGERAALAPLLCLPSLLVTMGLLDVRVMLQLFQVRE